MADDAWVRGRQVFTSTTRTASPARRNAGGTTGTDGPTTPPGFGSGGVGDGGEKNAMTFRSAKSRWKNNGRATKGTSNLKFSRAAGFGGFGASAATF